MQAGKIHESLMRADVVGTSFALLVGTVGLHLPGLAVIFLRDRQDLPEALSQGRFSIGVAASTRASRLRYIQSAEPM